MIRAGRVGGIWLGVCLAAVTLAACGSDGSSGVAIPPAGKEVVPSIRGTIFAPADNSGVGVYAAVPWWRWPEQLALGPRAYGLQHIAPIESDENVSLSQLDSTNAAHGSTDAALLLAQARTGADGQFEVFHSLASHPEDVCRLMLAVGRGDQQTRAFVLSHNTDLNAVSEAVVRIVLQRLAESATQLCDFQTAALLNIYNQAWIAAFSVSGTSVADINDKAFAKVSASAAVRQAIDDAVGAP